MIDDLVTRGTQEPYRMFTSRAEYRLQLREDNADRRLTETGRGLGLVDDCRWAAFSRKREAIERERQRLHDIWVTPGQTVARALESACGVPLSKESRALDLLRRPELDYARLVAVEGLGPGLRDARAAEQLEIEARYSGYLGRQQEDIERRRRHEDLPIPPTFDYGQASGLSTEIREKLERTRPDTVGQASRIPGMTPAAVSLLLVYLRKAGQKVA